MEGEGVEGEGVEGEGVEGERGMDVCLCERVNMREE